MSGTSDHIAARAGITDGASATASYVDWLRHSGVMHPNERVLECDTVTSGRAVVADADGNARVVWASRPNGVVPVDVQKVILEAAHLQTQDAFVEAVKSA